jgi:hypothetical protein
MPIAEAARSKASVYGRSLVGIAGSNHAGGEWMSVCCECCVLSGRGLCYGLITRPEESYRVWCVWVCDREASIMRRSRPPRGCCDMEKNIYIIKLNVYFCVLLRRDTVISRPFCISVRNLCATTVEIFTKTGMCLLIFVKLHAEKFESSEIRRRIFERVVQYVSEDRSSVIFSTKQSNMKVLRSLGT